MKNIIDTIIGLAAIVFCSKEKAQRLFNDKELFGDVWCEFHSLNDWYKDEISGKSQVRYWAAVTLLDLYDAGGKACFYENLELGFAQNEAFEAEYRESVNVLNKILRHMEQFKIDLSKPDVYLYEGMLPDDEEERKYCEEVIKEFNASCERDEKEYAEEVSEEVKSFDEPKVKTLTHMQIYQLLPYDAAMDYLKLHCAELFCFVDPRDYPEPIKKWLSERPASYLERLNLK